MVDIVDSLPDRRRPFIDPQLLRIMAGLFCSEEEIAEMFETSVADLRLAIRDDPLLGDAMREGRAFGKMTLRRGQLETAVGAAKGNAAMLIWLGKQADILGQMDVPDISSRTVDVNVRYTAEWGATPASLGYEDGPRLSADAEAEEG